MAEDRIRAEELTLRYGPRRGIEGVTLDVEPGRILGFLGPNGAGKTTTIRILLGLMQADSGFATIGGLDSWSSGAEARRRLGYVAGDVRLYPWLTLRRGLRFLSDLRGHSVVQAGMELAEQFRLEPDLRVSRMSRGNRQKVSLVLALAPDPQFLILDEPTSGLDPLIQDVLCRSLRQRRDAGRTILFSSHTLSEVEQLCDHVVMIRSGRVIVNESVRALKDRSPRICVVTVQSPEKAEELLGVLAEGSSPHTEFQLLETRNLSEPGQIQIHFQGSVVPLMDNLQPAGLLDFTVGAPSLEALFRQHYESDGAAEHGEETQDAPHKNHLVGGGR